MIGIYFEVHSNLEGWSVRPCVKQCIYILRSGEFQHATRGKSGVDFLVLRRMGQATLHAATGGIDASMPLVSDACKNIFGPRKVLDYFLVHKKLLVHLRTCVCRKKRGAKGGGLSMLTRCHHVFLAASGGVLACPRTLLGRSLSLLPPLGPLSSLLCSVL